MKKVILIFVLMTNIFLVNLQAEYTRDSGIVTSAKTLLQWQDNFEDVYNSDEYNNGNFIKRLNSKQLMYSDLKPDNVIYYMFL